MLMFLSSTLETLMYRMLFVVELAARKFENSRSLAMSASRPLTKSKP